MGISQSNGHQAGIPQTYVLRQNSLTPIFFRRLFLNPLTANHPDMIRCDKLITIFNKTDNESLDKSQTSPILFLGQKKHIIQCLYRSHIPLRGFCHVDQGNLKERIWYSSMISWKTRKQPMVLVIVNGQSEICGIRSRNKQIKTPYPVIRYHD